MYYDLDNNGDPVLLPDGEFPTKPRWQIETMVGRTKISTVFLSIDHAFRGQEPLLFETMIFGNKKYEHEQWRYHTKTEATKGHEHAIRKVEGLSGLLRKL